MSKKELLYCDRRGCGRPVEKIDSENRFLGFSSLKIRCWSKKGFHLCNEHVNEFKENYSIEDLSVHLPPIFDQHNFIGENSN